VVPDCNRDLFPGENLSRRFRSVILVLLMAIVPVMSYFLIYEPSQNLG
jgi:hypothetical protein